MPFPGSFTRRMLVTFCIVEPNDLVRVVRSEPRVFRIRRKQAPFFDSSCFSTDDYLPSSYLYQSQHKHQRVL